MSRLVTSLVVPAALVAAISLPASAAAPSLTPDQQLVAGLEQTRSTARAILQGTGELGRLTDGMRRARRAAPHAVGALDSPTMPVALDKGMTLAVQAQRAILRDGNASVRTKLRRLLALTSAALGDFGVPLEKDFSAFAVNRDFAYLPKFANYSGLSATADADVTEVVIGAADRQTANAGEVAGPAGLSAGLPITGISVAVFSDSLGFTSRWCELESGLITCRIRPAMRPDCILTIAFGPKLPKGTKLLVKFRSATGDRSYAVFATR